MYKCYVEILCDREDISSKYLRSRLIGQSTVKAEPDTESAVISGQTRIRRFASFKMQITRMLVGQADDLRLKIMHL